MVGKSLGSGWWGWLGGRTIQQKYHVINVLSLIQKEPRLPIALMW